MESQRLGRGTVEVKKADLCRLCMKSCDHYLGLSNEVTIGKWISIGKTIQDLLNLSAAEGDGLPGTVCCQCVTKLKEFREFKEMCIKSAIELRGCASSETVMTDVRGSNPNESLGEQDECGEEDLADKAHSDGEAVCNYSPPFEMEDQRPFREEEESQESLADERNKWRKNLNDVPLVTVSTVKSDPLDVEQMMSDTDDTGETSERNIRTNSKSKLPLLRIAPNDSQKISTPMVLLEGNLRKDGSTLPPVTFEVQKRKDFTVNERENFIPQDYPKFSMQFEDERTDNDGCVLSCGHNVDSAESMCNIYGVKQQDKCMESAHVRGNSLANMSLLPGTRQDSLSVENHSVSSVKIEVNTLEPVQSWVGTKESDQNCNSSGQIGGFDGRERAKCNVCEREFKYWSDFVRHSYVHSGEKTFKCDMCTKEFKHKRGLVKHTRLHHSKKKSFDCGICGREFYQKCNLANHVRTHTGVKGFLCTVCGSGFDTKDNLMKHLSLHCASWPSVKCES